MQIFRKTSFANIFTLSLICIQYQPDGVIRRKMLDAVINMQNVQKNYANIKEN